MASTTTIAPLPATTGTQHHYRIVYFKLCGTGRNAPVTKNGGAVDWQTARRPLFKTSQVIDLPAHQCLDVYRPAPCPEVIRQHVAEWLVRTAEGLPVPQPSMQRDWEFVCRLASTEVSRPCRSKFCRAHVLVRVLLRAAGKSPATCAPGPQDYAQKKQTESRGTQTEEKVEEKKKEEEEPDSEEVKRERMEQTQRAVNEGLRDALSRMVSPRQRIFEWLRGVRY